jgi:hypothetical protein
LKRTATFFLILILGQSASANLGVLNDVRRDTVERPAAVAPSAPRSIPSPPQNATDDSMVDLNSLGTDTPPAPAVPKAGADPSKGQVYRQPLAPSGDQRWFKVYFDFLFYARPGVANLTFDTFHNFLLFEATPMKDIIFSFDVNPTPKYFELDWQASEKLQLRAGKIWIPFDDMSPHNIYGGRVDVSKLAPGAAFLPDLWTDLGVAMKYQLVDTKYLNLLGHLYIVNGFRSGGTNPANNLDSPSNYPSFADISATADNNRNKAVGGRVHAILNRKFGFGLSYYTGRWSDDSLPAYGVSMVGADAQVRLGLTEFRAGIVGMNVDIPNDNFKRGGLYLELGKRFGFEESWKILGRGGSLQMDNRVRDVTDQKILGASILKQIGIIQLSLEHSRDFTIMAKKRNYTFTAFRIVTAF